MDLTARDGARPISNYFARRRPTFGVAGRALRTGSYQWREFLREALDDFLPLVGDADAQDDFDCRRSVDFQCWYDIARPETLDERSLRRKAGFLELCKDDFTTPACLMFCIATENRQHSRRAIAGAIGRTDFVKTAWRATLGAAHANAISAEIFHANRSHRHGRIRREEILRVADLVNELLLHRV